MGLVCFVRFLFLPLLSFVFPLIYYNAGCLSWGAFFQLLGSIYEGSGGLYTRRHLRQYWRGRHIIFARHEISTFIFLSCSDVSVPGDDSCRVLDGLKSPNNDPCSLKDKSVRQKGEDESLKFGWFPGAIMEDQH